MDTQFLMKTAVLAGEIMLRSGAETYRVEDTMKYMIMTADNIESIDIMVVMTGITATLRILGEQPITIAKRVDSVGTNMKSIEAVNNISRNYCSKQISIEEAYAELQKIGEEEYSAFGYAFGTFAICIGFTLFFGGNIWDVIAASFVSLCQVIFTMGSKELKLYSFIRITIVSIGIAFSSAIMKEVLGAKMDVDTVMISAIMPLVPGMAITNALRDTLRGDYLAGLARTLEAFMKAAAIALGIGLGFAMFGNLF